MASPTGSGTNIPPVRFPPGRSPAPQPLDGAQQVATRIDDPHVMLEVHPLGIDPQRPAQTPTGHHDHLTEPGNRERTRTDGRANLLVPRATVRAGAVENAERTDVLCGQALHRAHGAISIRASSSTSVRTTPNVASAAAACGLPAGPRTVWVGRLVFTDGGQPERGYS